MKKKYYFRNAVIGTVALFLLLAHFSASAMNLWLRPDQAGAKALASGQPERAAKLFQNSRWQGVANYRAKNYQQALQDFNKNNDSFSLYNRGNALAHLGELQEAINAYESALKMDANNQDAKFNRDYLKKILEQQQNQQQNKENQQSKNQQNQDPNKQNNNDAQKQQDQNNSTEKNEQQQSSPEQEKTQPESERKKNNSEDKNEGQQNKNSQNNEGNNSDQESKQQMKEADKKSENAQQQAMQQWLKRIPDDPGGLLKQKFIRDLQRRQADGTY